MSDVVGTGRWWSAVHDRGCSPASSASRCAASSGDGSMPNSAPSTRRKSSNTRSASACRPVTASARHQQRSRSFAERLGVGERAQLGRQTVGRAGGEPDLGAALERTSIAAPRGGPPRRGRRRGRRAPDRPGPAIVRARRRARRGRRRLAAGVAQCRRQAVGVDDHPRGVEPVPVGDRLDDVLGQGAAQPEQVVLQRRDGIIRPRRGPEGLDRRVRRDGAAASEHEQREQTSLERPGRRDIAILGVDDAKRPEHIDAQSASARHGAILAGPFFRACRRITAAGSRRGSR